MFCVFGVTPEVALEGQIPDPVDVPGLDHQALVLDQGPVVGVVGPKDQQVWSLSPFEMSCQLLTNVLYQVSSVSLLMTSSTALANDWHF